MSDAIQFIEDSKSAWDEVFPNSRCVVRTILGSTCFAGYLSKDSSEVANGIINNDPLSYSGWYRLDRDDVYKEDGVWLTIKPVEGTNYVYSSAKIRCKSIKEPNREKLVKRFLEVREFIRKEKDNTKNLCFDINQKV